MNKISYNLNQLNSLVSSISLGDYKVKIGIMGGKASQTHAKGKASNAEIGLVHEYGSFSKNIPARSFLRMPLFYKSNVILSRMSFKAFISAFSGNKLLFLKQLGIVCEGVIQEAFATMGFGMWRSLKSKTISRKKGQNPSPLINTGQLRRSISSQVVHK